MTYVNGKPILAIFNGKQISISIMGRILTSDGMLTSDGLVFLTADGKRFITKEA